MSARDAALVREALAAQDWRTTGMLSLARLGLRELPSLPEDLAGLRSLDLGSNRLTAVPAQVLTLFSLERLRLAGNRLAMLHPSVGGLVALRELDLADNRLRALPPSLAACTALEHLDLCGNRLRDLDVLASLRRLTDLDLASNGLGTIPRLPTSLEALDLSANAISAVPAWLASLTKLRRLDVSGNALTSGALGPLSQLPLDALFLDDNRLDVPPLELAQLPLMSRFSALGNPFAEGLAADIPPEFAAGRAAERAVYDHILGWNDPQRRYYDGATYSYDFEVVLDEPADARTVLDLYYKRFRELPATIRLGDGTGLRLGDMSRSTALEIATGEQRWIDRASVGIEPSRGTALTAMAFFAQALARVPHARLVSGGDVVEHRAPLLPRGSADEAVEPPRAQSRERVLNVAVADVERHVLPATAPLRPMTPYLVRVDIGPRSPETVVANPIAVPVSELAPDAPDGWWFAVVVVSTDVDVAPRLHQVFLPFTGPSWVCGCEGSDHACTPDERSAHLWVSVRTREPAAASSMRCTVYHRNNAIQSLSLGFSVADSPVATTAIIGVIDYSLADDVARAEALEARSLNVLTNEAPGGTHTVVVNDGDRVIAVDVGEARASAVLAALRSKLTATTLGDDGKSFQYDERNMKPTKAFVQDLAGLARLGSQLMGTVVPDIDDRTYLRDRLRERATIQISRVTRTTFPWALIYDIECEVGATWSLCPLLGDWESRRGQLATYPAVCPCACDHGLNVLCPYGFWGFRHLIEQPPSVRRGVLRNRILVECTARAVAARSLALDQALAASHFAELGECLNGRFELDPCDSLEALRAAFADPGLPLVYFYCHGRTAILADTQMEIPILEIGANDVIGPTDFAAWHASGGWGTAHWSEVAPLVFINGCGTAALKPRDIVTFVEALAGMKAAGVIGTETAVDQRVAGEVALSFYEQFAGDEPQTVGLALHRTRIDLLAKGNVSGLVYTPFCSMDLALETLDTPNAQSASRA